MYREMMKSKLHRAVVTEANLNYVGSITIDEELMTLSNILPNEKVQVVNNNNGERFETYVISGAKGSHTICINGAAARLVQPGDTVIIISYTYLDDHAAKVFTPKVVLLDEKNHVVKLIEEKEKQMY